MPINESWTDFEHYEKYNCHNCPIGLNIINKFDAVQFRYGYTKRTMIFKIDSITTGKGNPEWGASNEEVFIIKLDNRLK